MVVGPSGAQVPYQLLAVARGSDTGLSAVVPAGLPVGTYTLIVTNSDRRIGVATNGITITNNRLPLIASITPKASVASGSGTSTTLTITGENFSGVGTKVQISCSDLISTNVVVSNLTVSFATANTLVAALPTLSAANLCDVIVTNTDGATVAYWAMGTLSGSQNLPFAFAYATSMSVARRALTLSEIRPTLSASYLFAIGGDNGNAANPIASTEFVSLSRTGGVGSSWSAGRSLPDARTLHSATVIGSYIYVIGGFNATGAQSTVWRAQVLSPLAVPTVSPNVSVNQFENSTDSVFEIDNNGKGFARWYYYVSAVFHSTYARNPSGAFAVHTAAARRALTL